MDRPFTSFEQNNKLVYDVGLVVLLVTLHDCTLDIGDIAGFERSAFWNSYLQVGSKINARIALGLDLNNVEVLFKAVI